MGETAKRRKIPIHRFAGSPVHRFSGSQNELLMRNNHFFPILILAILLNSSGVSAADTWISVRWINDGDTIILRGGERVRYNGINAPEIAHGGHGRSAEPHGNAAKRYNIKLVKAKKVRLEFDSERRDRYGRLLAYVFLADGTFVNVEMVANGVAYFLPETVNKEYARLLLTAQRKAMSARKGMWRDLNENTQRYIGNRRSVRFHLKTCPFAKKIKEQNRIYFNSSRDAFWAGYAPAKGCIKIAELFGKP
jgi:endonuclease YncB( thermonuclease family)